MECTLFLDTNALLSLGENAFKEKFIIAQKTLEEIENIKVSNSKDGEVKYKARQISRLLDKHDGEYDVVLYSPKIKEIIDSYFLSETPDNIILASAYYYNSNVSEVLVCSDDLNCKFISRNIFRLPTKGVSDINLVKNLDEYLGYKELTLSDEEMSYFYCHTNENIYDCILNEYLIIKKSDGEVVDYRKWDGSEYRAISYKQINSAFMGKIKPLNPQQVLAFDMLQNKDQTIKVVSGKFGTGKDMIMIANALKLIEEGKFDKLIYIRNAVDVKDSSAIGFLPGSKDEKLRPYAMPLADHLGGETGLDMQIMAGNIEIEHLGYIRGRDLKNAIVYCSEAENLTKEHVQLLIGRIGSGSSLWLNGDFKQTDSAVYRMNNGLLSAVQKLAGHEKFGYVQLLKTERSETAAMADLLD
ncbi:PhoH family protein [[Ruminococcus] gnavus]|uniref:PhoH family protein n=2 Tax=Mediterraneibacter gnavus TaxID=33038 RepID=UPI00232FFDE1|nr:PhoH family protein [Mediterraneibacter gnavus]MDB8706528.1 PhoH family protein [Mediterraneibacter gnavus]